MKEEYQKEAFLLSFIFVTTKDEDQCIVSAQSEAVSWQKEDGLHADTKDSLCSSISLSISLDNPHPLGDLRWILLTCAITINFVHHGRHREVEERGNGSRAWSFTVSPNDDYSGSTQV